MTTRALLLPALALSTLLGCEGAGSETAPAPATPSYQLALPAGFPAPFIPANNPLSEPKIALGKRLFSDNRLSGNQTMSCASCHFSDKGFADGKVTPTGSTGDVVPRNAPGLVNVGYFSTLTWANPTLTTLEDQAVIPLINEHPVELGIASLTDEALARLRDDAQVEGAFTLAFPEDAEPVSIENIAKAIASYERTLVAGRSPYDRYSYDGDTGAMSASAVRGMDLFFSERTECYHCHSGFLFTTAVRTADTVHLESAFENTGLYNLDGMGAYPGDNVGLYEFTMDPTDMGRMRIPTLRNLTLTAPYMHDGSLATLGEVIDHYAEGGRTIKDGPFAGVGKDSPYKSPLVKGFLITPEEKDDLVHFLESLTEDKPVGD